MQVQGVVKKSSYGALDRLLRFLSPPEPALSSDRNVLRRVSPSALVISFMDNSE